MGFICVLRISVVRPSVSFRRRLAVARWHAFRWSVIACRRAGGPVAAVNSITDGVDLRSCFVIDAIFG